MKIITMSVGLLQVNTYIIYDETLGEAAIIDPGANGEGIYKEIAAKKLRLKYILLTHGHFDHIGAVGLLKDKTGANIAIHREDAPCLGDSYKNLSFSIGMDSIQPQADIILEHGDNISIGDINLKVIHTPGHSPGSISLVGDGFVFTGDTLFQGSIGRTDLVGGNMDQILNSIKERLLVLNNNTIVYPGHEGKTTIGVERLNNPFLEGLI
jgi:hydroxyacylglutathione hydrolase